VAEPPGAIARLRPLGGPAPAAGELRFFVGRLAILGAAILGLLVIGTIGFVAIEGVSVAFAFEWTLDTIATVGSIPNPTEPGARVLKVVLEVLGVGTLFYALVTVTEFFVAGHLGELLRDRRTRRMIESLSGHHLICGFGRVGRQVARDLADARQSLVVIDDNPDNRVLAEERGAPFIEGSPSDDEILRAAGIHRARALVACMDSDAENIFTTLTARELRDDLLIIARASVEDTEKKLRRAGADRVISPYKTSGSEMARLALTPQVVDVVDVAPAYRMEEIEVAPGCRGDGQTIDQVRGSALVVALRRAGGALQPLPPGATTLAGRDVVVAMGPDAEMDRLEAEFEAPVAAEQART
jgi:voltage-gated potassium channel